MFTAVFDYLAAHAWWFGSMLCAVFLYHVHRKRVRKDQHLGAAVRQYVSIQAIYIFGSTVRHQLRSQTQRVADVQKSFLLKQLRSNAHTEYGKKYSFASIQSVDEFTSRHTLTRYEHYAPYIQRMLEGETNVLTREDPVIFGVSSGTSGEGCKTLPTSKRQRLQFFLQAVAVLYCCLIEAFPQTGKYLRRSMKIFYNPTKWRTSKSGIRIGPNSSTPSSMKGLLHMYSTPPAGFELVSEPEALYIHLLFALKDRQLGMIEGNFASVVYSALKTLQKELPNLIQDIALGTLSPLLDIPKHIRVQLEKLLKPDPSRAKEIEQAFGKGITGVCRRLWPGLGVVLAADSGTFAPYGDKLRETFCEGIPLYSPVYAATEGLIGINLWPDQLPSRYLMHPGVHFFEFIPVECCEEAQPQTLQMHQVEENKMYEVVLTNVSGLCRYRLGDVVKVTGFYNQCPVIQFMYRLGQFLNVRGEKTSESLFYEALSAAVAQWEDITLVDYCCSESIVVEGMELDACSRDKPFYHVFLELEKSRGGEDVHLSEAQKAQVDYYLCEKSFVYASFRQKGSIDVTKVYLVLPGAFQELRDYVIRTTDASTNQYKVPRVLKNKTQASFMLERLVS